MVNIKNMKAQAPIFIMAVAIFIILGIGIFSIFALGGYNPSSTNHGVLVSSLGLASGCVVANCGYAFGPDTVGTQTSGIQEAIRSCNASCIISLRAGTFLLNRNILSAPDQFTDGKGTVILQGAGMYQTIIQRNGTNAGTLIGYGYGGSNPKLSQIIVQDLTLDGNYAGQGGKFPGYPTARYDALASMVPPYTSATNPPSGMVNYSGPYNEFNRVRFYRATCFGIQGESATIIINSVFDKGGQPDLSVNSTHCDNIGGGSDVITYINNITFMNSGGNYVDIVAAVTGHPSRVIFENSKSINHQQGGVYAMNYKSIIINNELANQYSGSYLGYDSGTVLTSRGYNLVSNNTLTNILLASKTQNTDTILGPNNSTPTVTIPIVTIISSTSTSTITNISSTVIIRGSTTIGSTTTILQKPQSVQALILNPVIKSINTLFNLIGLKPIGLLN